MNDTAKGALKRAGANVGVMLLTSKSVSYIKILFFINFIVATENRLVQC
jgi:hypothetical protein